MTRSAPFSFTHFISGRTVDRDGNPLHRVRITPSSAEPRGWDLGPAAYTARDGTFHLRGLPGGKISLSCLGMHVSRKVVQNVAVDRDDVTIVMERPAGLAGRVIDGTTGMPLAK